MMAHFAPPVVMLWFLPNLLLAAFSRVMPELPLPRAIFSEQPP